MQLSPASFNRFLSGIGQDTSWRKSDACPCVSPLSGAALPSCPHCSGKGRIWQAPVAGRIGVSSMASKRQYAAFGIFEAGDLLLTLPSDSPLYNMGQFDIVKLTGATQPFSIILDHGTRDEFQFTPEHIDRVFWIDGANIIESDARDVADMRIVWGAHTQPAAGRKYSVTGRWNPDYFVFQELPTERAHHGGLPLPRRVVVRRFDLYGR